MIFPEGDGKTDLLHDSGLSPSVQVIFDLSFCGSILQRLHLHYCQTEIKQIV